MRIIKKQLLQSGILLALILSIISPAFCASVFSVSELKDVLPSDPNYEGIRSLVERWGIIESDENGLFHPEKPLTHADFVIILDRALSGFDYFLEGAEKSFHIGSTKNVIDTTKLTDISKETNYYNAVISLNAKYGLSIVNNQNQFEPNAPVTHHQLKTILEAALHSKITEDSTRPVMRGEFCTELNLSLDDAENSLYAQ